ncbi:MAG: DUF4097 family beta strand repeat protein [Candidatus Eremiobacteraeota bacterium]|nr:DUF4097 family beta strand repeat protein [Candidatus Eremiobacteraeota bacterium]
MSFSIRGGRGYAWALRLTLSIALAAGCLPSARAGAAVAELSVQSGALPMITIHSSDGTITIGSGEGDVVRLTSGSGSVAANLSRFVVSPAGDGRVMLPRTQLRRPTNKGWRDMKLPARNFAIPGLRDGSDGITVDNPGGDMTVQVPRRVGAVFVNAGKGSVVLERLRGAYVVVSGGGDVRLRNVVGRGLIRTLDGTVSLTGVGGNVQVETAAGRVVARGMNAARADVRSQGGDIDWRFGRMGAGAYRFRTGSGDVRIRLPAGAGADVDAQSNFGRVVNDVGVDAARVQVRYATPRALSMSVAGGGPEITVMSRRGTVTVSAAAGAQP